VPGSTEFLSGGRGLRWSIWRRHRAARHARRVLEFVTADMQIALTVGEGRPPAGLHP